MLLTKQSLYDKVDLITEINRINRIFSDYKVQVHI